MPRMKEELERKKKTEGLNISLWQFLFYFGMYATA